MVCYLFFYSRLSYFMAHRERGRPELTTPASAGLRMEGQTSFVFPELADYALTAVHFPGTSLATVCLFSYHSWCPICIILLRWPLGSRSGLTHGKHDTWNTWWLMAPRHVSHLPSLCDNFGFGFCFFWSLSEPHCSISTFSEGVGTHQRQCYRHGKAGTFSGESYFADP